MTPRPHLTTGDILRVLNKNGWRMIGKTDSHILLERGSNGERSRITLPTTKTIKATTLEKILKPQPMQVEAE